MKIIKTMIYPTEKQAMRIDETIHYCNCVYNSGLNAIDKKLKNNEMFNITEFVYELPKIKKQYSFLRRADATALKQALYSLSKSYNLYLLGKSNFPKPTTNENSGCFTTTKIKRETAHSVKLKKIGVLKTAEKIKKKWNIRSAIIKKKAGKYYILLQIDYTPPKRNPKGDAVGIDVGIKTFAVLSDGKKYENIKPYYKHQDKIKKIQHKLSLTKKGSKNREKTRIKLAKVHLKITNTRIDYLHKVSSEIANNYSFVAVENLDIAKMISRNKLGKSVCDCSWSHFFQILKYKCKLNNTKFVKIGRYEPSSKLCSNCGYLMDEMPLEIRSWTCPKCGAEHDRDLNASKNILKIALSDRKEEPVDTCNNSCIEQENL